MAVQSDMSGWGRTFSAPTAQSMSMLNPASNPRGRRIEAPAATAPNITAAAMPNMTAAAPQNMAQAFQPNGGLRMAGMATQMPMQLPGGFMGAPTNVSGWGAAPAPVQEEPNIADLKTMFRKIKSTGAWGE